MSSMTPFFSITASSSFFTSSKVKPYWKPEQPPPVTNTRSLSSGLPSSSISCLTLFAALSLNTSGEGISVTAFISSHSWIRFSSSARGELQLDPFGIGDVVHQPALDHRPLVDFDALVVHIAFDLRPRLEFERLGGVDGPVDRAVDHDVRGLHFAVDARIGRHHQRPGLALKGPSTLRKYLNANRKAAAPASPGSGKLMIALCPPSVRFTSSSNRPLKSRPCRVVGVRSSSR